MCDTPSNCYYHKDIADLLDMYEHLENELKKIVNILNELQNHQQTNEIDLAQLTKKINQMEKKQPWPQ